MNPEELQYQKMEHDIQSLLTYSDDGKEFLATLRGKVLQNYQPTKSKNSFFALKPVWITTLVLMVLISSVLIIGPQRVYASFMNWLGYIPGVGLVEQDPSIHILKEPVSLTRDGITVSVNQAVITSTETRLDYGISGVPLSAYPKGEEVSGCIEQPFLQLPDGSKVSTSDPIPDQFDSATFVLPCIFNTLPGQVPTDWEIEISFIVAPPDFKILPVVDVPDTLPSQEETSVEQTEIVPTETAKLSAQVSIDKYIETDDGYIMIGMVRPDIAAGEWLQITGAASIRDAKDQKISYEYPMDIQYQDETDEPTNGGGSFTMEIKGTGVTFPITITFSGVVISQVDPDASASLTVDVGENPQPGDVIEINQTVDLAGFPIQLLDMTVDSRNGYSFHIDPGEKYSSMSVQISGYQAVGGGSGATWGGPFYTSKAYSVLPTGELEIVFSKPMQTSPTESWTTSWQPETERTFVEDPQSKLTCWNSNTLSDVPAIDPGLDGKVFLTSTNPELEILSANLDGSDMQTLSSGNAKAALSNNGENLAFTAEDGIHILNLSTAETTLIPGTYGRFLLWSPDDTRLANVRYDDLSGIIVMNVDGSNQVQLTNLGYEELSGWSADGNSIYYAIPGAGGDGFLLRSVNISTTESTDLFVLENSSRKAPMSTISPDGQWIAYRAQNNNSLYLKNMDGSPATLLLDHPGIAVNGIAWEKEGHLLGVSIITDQNQNGEVFHHRSGQLRNIPID